MFFTETSSNNYLELILTQFFRNEQKKRKYRQYTSFARTDVLQSKSVSRQKPHHVPRNMLSKCETW
jgi:hypothetical protein